MPEDKRIKARQRGDDTPVVLTRDSAGAKARSKRVRILLGDSVSVELSPYDLSRGRITYRFKEGPPDPADVTIEGNQPTIVIEDTLDELYSAVTECVTAVDQVHEQIEKNRPEIEALRKETRRLLSELEVTSRCRPSPTSSTL